MVRVTLILRGSWPSARAPGARPWWSSSTSRTGATPRLWSQACTPHWQRCFSHSLSWFFVIIYVFFRGRCSCPWSPCVPTTPTKWMKDCFSLKNYFIQKWLNFFAPLEPAPVPPAWPVPWLRQLRGPGGAGGVDAHASAGAGRDQPEGRPIVQEPQGAALVRPLPGPTGSHIHIYKKVKIHGELSRPGKHSRF